MIVRTDGLYSMTDDDGDVAFMRFGSDGCIYRAWSDATADQVRRWLVNGKRDVAIGTWRTYSDTEVEGFKESWPAPVFYFSLDTDGDLIVEDIDESDTTIWVFSAD